MPFRRLVLSLAIVGKVCGWKSACAIFLLCVATAIASHAQTFTPLFNFDGTDGAYPRESLVQGFDGNLYGATERGGANDSLGTLFEFASDGTLSTLYSFCGQTGCTDGEFPYTWLTQIPNGDFYGTTSYGGVHNGGTVFSFNAEHQLTIVHSFAGYPSEGSDPMAGLARAANGNLYGATFTGGTGDAGTIFQVTPEGNVGTLHNFCVETDCPDGAYPSGLIQAMDGNLYGTTENGGGYLHYGTIFKITPSGTLTTLYNFCLQSACSDGANPFAGLIQANDGNFYGTTTYGGSNESCTTSYGTGCGTIFRVTPKGKLTTLHSFCAQTNCTDGASPYASLIQATDGMFYGTTYSGGAYNYGTIFRITPEGNLTTLVSFSPAIGDYPFAALMQATNGVLYGAAYYDGMYGDGTIFSLSLGVPPFIEVMPGLGKVGTHVTVLGNNLTGATELTFNGISATYSVVSATEIRATVPSGATTGNVQVNTPSGTLTSNVVFRVRP